MEGKTNFSKRLKQFDGLTWLILTPLFYATDKDDDDDDDDDVNDA